MAVPLSTIEGLPYLGGNSPGFVSVDSSGLQRLKKSKLGAITDPTTLDDSGAGYAVGSRWTNTASGKVWECVDSSPLGAVWKDLTAVSPPGGASGNLQYNDGSGGFSGVSGSSVSGSTITLAGAGQNVTKLSVTPTNTNANCKLLSLTLPSPYSGLFVEFNGTNGNRLGSWYDGGGYLAGSHQGYEVTNNANASFALRAKSGTATTVPLQVLMHASQSGNAFEVNSSSGSGGNILRIDNQGAIRRTTPGDSLILSTRNVADNFTSTWTIGHSGDLVSSTAYGSNVSLGGGYSAVFHGSSAWRADSGGGAMVNGALLLNAATRISWSSSQWYNTIDAGLARNAAGVLEINNGTAGQYRDLIARKVTISGDSLLFGSNAFVSSSTAGALTLGGVYGGARMFITGDVPARQFLLSGEMALGWGAGFETGNLTTPSLLIRKDADNTLAQRNGTAPQILRVYNTYTSDTNYERGKVAWESNVLVVGTEKGSGGGVARDVLLQAAGLNAGQFDGSLVAGETRFLLYDVDTAQLQRVLVGANGTGPGGVGRALYLAAA